MANESKERFETNLKSVMNLASIFQYLGKNAPNVDGTYLLRSEYVLIISAFDNYLHEKINEVILNRFFNNEIDQNTILKIPLFVVQQIISEQNIYLQRQLLSSYIQKITKKDSYQSPSSIEKALNLIGIKHIWKKLGVVLETPPADVKRQLSLIVNRRNKIAHEADTDTFTGIVADIDISQLKVCFEFISNLVISIDEMA